MYVCMYVCMYLYIYNIYIYIYIYIYENLIRNAIAKLPHPWRGDNQGQEAFLAPSADKQTRVLKITIPPNHHEAIAR